jgi:putative aminopeptidase FrvX
MTDATLRRLKRLSEAIGVTGYRGPDNIIGILAAELATCVDRVDRDHMGSVRGVKFGEQAEESGRKVMLAAHLDEIGAMVTGIDDGFLRFTKVRWP